jgi:hypothetical protein
MWHLKMDLTKQWDSGTLVSISAQLTGVCLRLSVLCSPVEVKVLQGVLQNVELTHNFRSNSEFKQSQVKADDDDDRYHVTYPQLC